MPKEFTECVKGGGRVRTIKPKPGRYLPICFKGGKSHAGEVKANKKRRREVGAKE